jgi:hypothetical protein
MRTTTLYRVASVLLVVFALGHTIGFLSFRPPTAEANAVREAMNGVHFTIGHSSFSYGGFYVGFGLFVTVYLLFSAVLAWQFGTMARRGTALPAMLPWTFFGLQVATLGLSWQYFSLPPVVFSVVVAACVGAAAWRDHARMVGIVTEGA